MQDNLVGDENLFFSLQQVIGKVPKDIGEFKETSAESK